MISVQNHQQPLSGNKLKNIYRNAVTAICLGAILAVTSCSPKTTGVLRNPNVYGGKTDKDAGKETSKDDKTDKKEDATKVDQTTNIALLLPFQLNQVAAQAIEEEDVKRSALALDFYQGFQLGVNEANKKGKDMRIRVMDTEDNEMKNVALAATKDVSEASLIVGPVYPKEIRSFAKANTNKNVLQVSPLAAMMPTEFNIGNLVSITPPIRIHMRAIAADVAKKYMTGDKVIVMDARDHDHRQFIEGFDEELKKLNPNIVIQHVSVASQFDQALPDIGNTFVVCATTEKTQLRSLVTKLNDKVGDGYSIRLFGHPLWERIDFTPYSNFYRMDPTISSESHLKVWSSEVQNFQRLYKGQFKVEPSEYSYKGYDAGKYFAGLLNKYGKSYNEKLVDEKYSGLFSDYQFNFNPDWGYVNQAVKLKAYRNGSFQ